MSQILDAAAAQDVEMILDIILQIKISDSLKLLENVLSMVRGYSESEDAIFLLELSSQVCAKIIDENCKTNAQSLRVQKTSDQIQKMLEAVLERLLQNISKQADEIMVDENDPFN